MYDTHVYYAYDSLYSSVGYKSGLCARSFIACVNLECFIVAMGIFVVSCVFRVEKAERSSR